MLFSQNFAQGSESQRVTSGKATAQLVTSYDQALPNSDLHIALSLRLEKHWHTYWRNAGGPGVPAELYWTLPKGFVVGDIVWPLPKIVHTGPIVNYAFEDGLLLPMSLHIPLSARVGDVITIDAEASYLVCYEVCLPESAKLSLDIKIGEPIKDARWMANINRALQAAPQENPDFTSAVKRQDQLFVLDVKSKHLQAGQYKNPYFFPYVQDVIDADAPQVVQQGTEGLRLKLTLGWAGENEFKSMTGVVSYEHKIDGDWQRRGVIINARTDTSLDIGMLKPAPSLSQSSGTTFGLLVAVLSAFIGGMILNLMPCVFPVLSLKALGLSQTAHTNQGKVRRHGWLYTAGVMASFMALAAVLLSLKAGGAAIGWGFQLQSPVLLACLAILFFIIAFNLFGLFELGGQFMGHIQNTGSGLTQAPGGAGAFFTGVLAVIVATPCTAPFMAGALGYAFTQSALTALLIFTALGFGFAAPFLALSYAPHLLKRFPKPGPWMDVFKQFLAFPMLGAVIWLTWVLSSVSGEVAVLRLMSAMLGVAFAIWLFQTCTYGSKSTGARSSIVERVFDCHNEAARGKPTKPNGARRTLVT